MFTVLRNTSKPTLGKPEKESKRGMTKGKEGYRLEVAETFSSFSSQGAASVVLQLPALGGANFPQDAILTNLATASN